MIKLSDHFDYKRLLRFTAPSIGMLIFMSIYSVVDGFFVSNFVGTIPFAAINFVMPALMLMNFIGFLFGTGGGALIAKTIGEGNRVKANQIFSMLVYLSFFLGILFAIFGIIYIGEVAKILGATGEFLEQSITYGQIALLALPMSILQCEFQCLASTAEKPKLGFYVTVATGLTNIFLDALFIITFGWGIEGAAIATAVSEAIGGILPLIYFSRENSSLLRLTKTKFDGRALIQTCSNGISELLSSISMSIIGMLYNWQLLKYAGSDGVAAFGILIYAAFIFEAIFIGYSMGVSPIISFNYGAKNYSELKNVFKKSLFLIGAFAVIMFISAESLARPIAKIFVESDAKLLEMTVHAFRICSFAFLIEGFTMFISSFFTALNNGFISALISGLRTLVFEVGAVLIFPIIWGLDGVWFSMVGAEIMSVILSVIMLLIYRRRYNY
ncbi:MAG: MATE family efflux transporter [Selenomonadaceae bacterium]|nr:MATE family efflux transporter [Selenomonadaceae bacterium]